VTRTILLALLLPLAMRAQIALYTVNNGAEVPIGAVINLGDVAAGDTASVRIRVRNIGTTTANISYFFADGVGYTINRPALPFPIAPGGLQDALVSFRQTTPAPLYPANLRVDSDINSVSAIVIAAVVIGPALTVFPACTGSNGPPASIDFGQVQAGQLRLCNFSLQNPGADDMTIATFNVTGAAFQISTSSPKPPFTIPAGGAITFVVNFTPSAATSYTGSLAIETRTYSLKGTGFNTPLPTPLIEFDSGSVQSAQQRHLTMRLPAAASFSASGNVTLAFVPDSTLVTDDPTVVFLATGTRSLPFSVTQGSTLISIGGQTSAVFQTGTTSGQIRFTLSGVSTAGDATTTLTIPAAPISLDSAVATRRTGDLDIQLTGWDNTYSAGAMMFTFWDTSGHAFPPIHTDFTQDFRTFFTKAQAGSAFQVRVSFPVTGDPSGISSVDVQLSNSVRIEVEHLIFQ
jgi:ASPM-SPD-2-Hydin domain-containing protein